jgi:hypothetical protein
MADGPFRRMRRDVGSAVNATFGRARLKDFAPGEGVVAGAFRERLDERAWIPVPVPGDVHRALLDAGRIEDLFFDRNEDRCTWIEDREWWYRMSFDGPHRPLGPEERLRLVFNGLYTFATVWLNGEEIGSHSSMFREAVFDCWPVLSWSVLNYYGFGKAGYYYARRAYSPLLASFKALPDGSIELWLTNDTLSKVEGDIEVRLGTFEGEMMWVGNLQVHVPANSSLPVAHWSADRVSGSRDRYLSVSSVQGRFPSNRHFFAAIKDLRRAPVEPAIDITQTKEHELRVRLEASAYAYFVHLEIPTEATRFSDNYLDLEPGQERTISVINEKRALKAENIKVRWR